MKEIQRKIDYLRISITDRCNLRCRYCMPHAVESVPMREILTYEEIAEIVSAAAKSGIRHLRITGGEPLVRKGCADCVRMLKEIPGIETVMLTTNGVYLEKELPGLLKAGLDGVNISLDTLDAENYKNITGYDALEQVLSAIEACANARIRTKINVAAARELNENEIVKLAELSARYPADVRFIEMMPIGYGKQFTCMDNRELLEKIRESYPDIKPAEEQKGAGYGPAVYYQIPGFYGRTGFISAMHQKFCKACSRLRLTSTGKLKYCLCYDEAKDVRKIVRMAGNGREKEEKLLEAFAEAKRKKPAEHRFEKPAEISEKRRMNEIGG